MNRIKYNHFVVNIDSFNHCRAENFLSWGYDKSLKAELHKAHDLGITLACVQFMPLPCVSFIIRPLQVSVYLSAK